MTSLLSLLLLIAAAPSPVRAVTGAVRGEDGRPVAGVVVCAVDPATDAIVAMAASDQDGQVHMQLRPHRHNFGIMSARYQIVRLDPGAPGDYALVLRTLPEPSGAGPAGAAPVLRVSGAILIRGRVVDEAGTGLAGVRVDGARATEWGAPGSGVRPQGVVVSSTFSGPNGAFTLPIPGGDTQLQARAPGLVLVRSAVQQEKGVARADRPILVMGIDSAVQEVVISQGHLLRIRPQDSIDPEYTPPAPVRAWLRYAYGICDAPPLYAREKRALKKYWYLEVLRRAPPNPAVVSLSSCVPAAQFGHTSMAAQAGAMTDFDVVLEVP
jgi:hypothetical protein